MPTKLILSPNVLEWLEKNTDLTYLKKNMYTCDECHLSVVTVDIDRGVTPFMMQCKATPNCNGAMTSSCYRCDQTIEPSYEWYRPEFIDDGSDEAVIQHLMQGGLMLRPAKKGKEENVFK